MKIVATTPLCCCPPWRLRGLEPRPTHPSMCFQCGRDVAAPEVARGMCVACIYCGLEHGWIPAIDKPIEFSDKPIWQ